jgi:hypothetical protein
MAALIRIVKWLLLLAGIGWAIFSARWFLFLASELPTSGAARHDLGGLFASLEDFTIVTGPALLALLFLTTPWPKPRD